MRRPSRTPPRRTQHRRAERRRLPVQYVYGDTLKAANGRCVDGKKELARLSGSVDEFACYVVEVCVDCGWNYLIRSTILGRGQAG